MGEALRRDAPARRRGWGARARELIAVALVASSALPVALRAQSRTPERIDRGRFTAVAFPPDLPLARALLDAAVAHDTFPGLPRPRARALIAIAPDARRFRDWTGPGAPEWGIAIAIPEQQRIVMHGSAAGSEVGDPVRVLRHELGHLALHEALGDLPPRWFDEGYASYSAGEMDRDQVLEASLGLLVHGVPSLDSLDAQFYGGAVRAGGAYALAYRAVSDLAALDSHRGLSLFFTYWKRSGSMDRAIREAYGLTQADFEHRWQRATMRRYGALAVMANLSALFAIIGLLVVPLYLARRGRDRRRLAELAAAEARASARGGMETLDAILAAAPVTGPPTADPEPSAEAERREGGGDAA